MNIAVASGKGGTGKTTVSVNLACTLAERGHSVAYADCDVEAPNGEIFLNPVIDSVEKVVSFSPKVNEELCDGCGDCADFCMYGGIAVVNGKVFLFPELCHACGGCQLVCPLKAIDRNDREIGIVKQGKSKNIFFLSGLLNIGVSTAPPVIKAVKDRLPGQDFAILDSAPGAACPMVEAVHDADFVILVSEPTPFGLNDLKIAVDTVRELRIPFGLVINRAGIGNLETEEYCRRERIEILVQIPHSLAAAQSYSRGELLVDKSEVIKSRLDQLADSIEKMSRLNKVIA